MIFRYPGGKSKKSVREKIVANFPQNYAEFRDIMVGGGGIFFHIPVDVKRWINDSDPHLMSVYSALKDRPKQFIQKCKKILPASNKDILAPARKGKAIYSAKLKDTFDKFSQDAEMDQAVRYLFIHRTVWGGRVRYSMKSRMYFSNPSGWNIVKTDKLEKAALIIKDAKVTCESYEVPLFEKGKDVLVYIDPPYFCNTEQPNSSRLYEKNFEKKDHEKLCEDIKQSKHKIVLSYDNNNFIRKMYKSFNIIEEKWTYCGTSSANGKNTTKQKGKELIIKNF